MFAGFSSCSKDDQLISSTTTAIETSTLESRGDGNPIHLDPVLTTAEVTARKAFLNELNESIYPSTSDISQFAWDVEYFVNKDNWAAHPGSDLMMVFETVTFEFPHPENDASNFTNATLQSIRTSIASQADTRQITTEQSIFRKVFRIANVSVEIPASPNGPAVLSIQIGSGIQEGPCPDGVNCPPEVLEPADAGVLILNYTDCSDPPERLPLTWYSDGDPPCNESDPQLLDLAKSYVNTFTYDNFGFRLPDGCNDLPASLISQSTGASANIINRPFQHFDVFNDGWDGTSCYEESYLYSPSYCTEDCAAEEFNDCVSPGGVDWVLEAVDDAVVVYHSSRLPSNYKWFCSNEYRSDALTSNCGLSYASWFTGMWIVE